MKIFLNIAVLLMLTISVIGCSSDSWEEPVAGDAEMVNLTLSVYAGDPDATGARSRVGILPGEDYFEGAASDYERMRTLRVVIVRPDGTVEHNEFLHRSIPASGLGEYRNIRLKVFGGETKQVYLFANEASMLTAGANPQSLFDFNTLSIGSQFPAEEIAALRLSCAPGTPLIDNSGSEKLYIPMSEQFAIDIAAPKKDGTDIEQSADLFITRAAVKFGFFFTLTARPTDTFTITGIEVSELSNTEYLLPRNTEYTPAKYPAYFADRYIYQYTVPADTVKKSYVFHPGLTFTPQNKVGDQLVFTPAIYFPETELAPGRAYNIRMLLDGDKEYSTRVELPNLPALPRNTYVKINASVGLSDLSMRVDVMPYAAVPLNPTFGFDDLLPRPPVVTGPTPPWIEM